MKAHEQVTEKKPEGEPAPDEVAKKAYAIHLKEGRPEGRDVQNCLEAETRTPHAGPEHHAEGGNEMSCCSDVMKPLAPSSCCTPQDTAAHAARAIRDSGCGCAPVVEGANSMKLVGVVTERDVCCGVAADDRRASEVRVEEIMRPASACCGADEPIEEARRTLHEHRRVELARRR